MTPLLHCGAAARQGRRRHRAISLTYFRDQIADAAVAADLPRFAEERSAPLPSPHRAFHPGMDGRKISPSDLYLSRSVDGQLALRLETPQAALPPERISNLQQYRVTTDHSARSYALVILMRSAMCTCS